MRSCERHTQDRHAVADHKLLYSYKSNTRSCFTSTTALEILTHAELQGVDKDSPHIKMFWEVLEAFSQADRRLFLRFACVPPLVA